MEYFIVYVLVTWAILAYRLGKLSDAGLRPLPTWLTVSTYVMAPIAVPAGIILALPRMWAGVPPRSWEEKATEINDLLDELNKYI